jgi:DNA-binding GntR family transcriptional regulator
MSVPRGDVDAWDLGGRIGQRHVLADDVYEVLRTALLEGTIAPNTRVKIDSLAVQLGVSNTPIRQALGRLEADGLVVKEPFRGFISSGVLNREDVRDVYEVRLLLEPMDAYRAASRASRTDVSALRKLLETAAGAQAADDRRALHGADRDLHISIARIGGNRAALEVLERLLVKSQSFASMYAVRDAAAKTSREHSAIVAAIAKHDATAAEDAMRTHLRNALTRMKETAD